MDGGTRYLVQIRGLVILSVTRNPGLSPDVGAARPAGLAFGPPGHSAWKRTERARRAGAGAGAGAGLGGGGARGGRAVGPPGPPEPPRPDTRGPTRRCGGPAGLGVRAPGAYRGGRRFGHGCPRPSLRGSSPTRPVGPGAARRRRRRRSGAAQPRSSCRAAASCVRATCPAGPLNKSCAGGRARGRAQRPLQPEGPHARGPRPSVPTRTGGHGGLAGGTGRPPSPGPQESTPGRDAPRPPPRSGSRRVAAIFGPGGRGPREGAARWAQTGTLNPLQGAGAEGPQRRTPGNLARELMDTRRELRSFGGRRAVIAG